MSRVGFTLYDPIEDETFPLPVNPYQDGGTTRSRSVSSSYSGGYQTNALDYHIGTIAYDESENLQNLSYTGRVYTAEEYNNLIYWFRKPNVITLTNHLNQTFNVMFQNFSLTRVRSRQHPYKHEYQLQLIVV